MDIKKLIPWNWFKKEEESTGKSLPIRRGDEKDKNFYRDDFFLDNLHRLNDVKFNNVQF
jgi:hypothetical protein